MKVNVTVGGKRWKSQLTARSSTLNGFKLGRTGGTLKKLGPHLLAKEIMRSTINIGSDWVLDKRPAVVKQVRYTKRHKRTQLFLYEENATFTMEDKMVHQVIDDISLKENVFMKPIPNAVLVLLSGNSIVDMTSDIFLE